MTLQLNGEPVAAERLCEPRKWKKGDQIVIDMPMKPVLVEANPLVEEAKNQVAIRRGPIVYCLEGQDISQLPNSSRQVRINDIAIPADIQFTERKMVIGGHKVTALEGDALLVNEDSWRTDELYRVLRPRQRQTTRIRLIPYYAWDNRGIDDMSIWLPLAR